VESVIMSATEWPKVAAELKLLGYRHPRASATKSPDLLQLTEYIFVSGAPLDVVARVLESARGLERQHMEGCSICGNLGHDNLHCRQIDVEIHQAAQLHKRKVVF
jgi:hypothetical protein